MSTEKDKKEGTWAQVSWSGKVLGLAKRADAGPLEGGLVVETSFRHNSECAGGNNTGESLFLCMFYSIVKCKSLLHVISARGKTLKPFRN